MLPELMALIRRFGRMPADYRTNIPSTRFLAVAFLAALASVASMAAPADPFEPTVTRAEHRLLTAAMDMAVTNVSAALDILLAHDLAAASPALDLAVGNLRFAVEDLDAAAAAYREALVKMPRFRTALVNLGRVYLRQERPREAADLYLQLFRDGQPDADTMLLLAQALLMQNQWFAAETACRQALLLRPDHTATMETLLRILMGQERYPEGLILLADILRRHPERRPLWKLRARTLMQMQRYDEAALSIEQARRLACADSEMLALLGDLYLQLHQPADALQAYELAFAEKTPAPARALRALEGFLLTGDFAGAERMVGIIEKLRSETPRDFGPRRQVDFLRLQAELAGQRGLLEQAVAHCEEALGIDPLDAETMLSLARLLHAAGRLEEAILIGERAARRRGHEADALVLKAQIEVDRQNYPQAVRLLEAAQTFRDQPHVAGYLEQVRQLTE